MRTLVLLGSGEFTQAMDETDTYLLSFPKESYEFEDKSVAILPTAAGQEENWQKWIDDGVSHFTKLGAKAYGVPVVKRQDTMNSDYLSQVEKASLIYFSGGEPGYLHQVFVGSLLWDAIIAAYKKGQIVAGSSAGAMVLGSWTLANGQNVFFKNAEPVWEKAFSIVNYTIFPHYDFAKREKEEVVEKVMRTAPKQVGKAWIGIDEDTALILINETDAKVMGKGNVYVTRDAIETVHSHGEDFILP